MIVITSVLRKEIWKGQKGTGNLILGEANHYDKMYGTGIRLTDPQALDDKSWPGDNILGEILMTIRGQLE